MNTARGKIAFAARAIRDLSAALLGYAGRRALLAGGLMISAALFEGVGLLLLVPILGVLINGPMHGRVGHLLADTGITSAGGQLQALLALFLLASVVRAQLSFSRDMLLGRLQLGFAQSERNEVIARLAHAGWSRLAGMSHARITSIITNDVSRSVVSTQFLLRITVSIMLLVVNTIVAISLAPGLVLLLVALLGLALVFFLVSQRDVFSLGSRVHRSAREMLGSTANLLSGLKTALAQEQQERFIAEFERVQTEVFLSSYTFQRNQAGSRRLFGIVSAVISTALVLGGYLLAVPPAKLLVVVVILGRLAGPVLQVQQNLQQLLFGLPSFVSIQQMRREIPPASARPPDDGRRVHGTLTLRDVAYRHRDGGGMGPLSLEIQHGAFLGIEGPSGAGKSTLVDVMAGLLEPQSGTMLVDGQPLDELRLRGWRRNLAYLGQQVYLFNDTMRANLGWAADDASEQEIWRALELAGAAELVRGLANGLDTPLGEHGVLFSGGERQRIALARSLLRKPGFLMLDEATSAIDIESEKGLLDRLDRLPDRPTIVMVAHRRESLARCERIVTMLDGAIIDQRAGVA